MLDARHGAIDRPAHLNRLSKPTRLPGYRQSHQTIAATIPTDKEKQEVKQGGWLYQRALHRNANMRKTRPAVIVSPDEMNARLTG
jgi:hypothetical protein